MFDGDATIAECSSSDIAERVRDALNTVGGVESKTIDDLVKDIDAFFAGQDVVNAVHTYVDAAVAQRKHVKAVMRGLRADIDAFLDDSDWKNADGVDAMVQKLKFAAAAMELTGKDAAKLDAIRAELGRKVTETEKSSAYAAKAWMRWFLLNGVG